MSKIAVILSIVCVVCVFFYFDLNQYLDPEIFFQKKQEFDTLYREQPLLVPLGFFLFYVLCATLSVPGAAILTLVAGFLFGFFVGSFIVSVGSTLGAFFAFLISRFLLKDFIQKKFSSRLKTINKNLKKDGGFYVFSLRLIPVFPYFMINLALGVTSISYRQFIVPSFLGMLPASLVFVNAGTQLKELESLKGILSLPIIASFCLLAGLPWIIKLMDSRFRRMRGLPGAKQLK